MTEQESLDVPITPLGVGIAGQPGKYRLRKMISGGLQCLPAFERSKRRSTAMGPERLSSLPPRKPSYSS
jgi:hypothetical protein